MKLALMQPYIFPYLGYWQLIHAVDCFVIYDDVSYIKNGFINRNYILLNGERHLITLNKSGASPYKPINTAGVGNNSRKILGTIEQAYNRAPFYKSAYEVISDILSNTEKNLAKYIEYSIRSISKYLGLDTEILVSSSLEKDNSLTGQDKVIHICKLMRANSYLNSIGGKKLYQKQVFSENGIELCFIKTAPIEYRQFGKSFVPDLSIIDIIMFNSHDEITNLLNRYDLV